MILFEFRLAMMIDEDEQLPSCAKTLRVYVEPRNSCIHWLAYCFIGQQPMKTFRCLDQNAEFWISDALITNLPCGQPCLTIEPCPLLMFASIIHQSCKIHNIFIIHPKILKFFAQCSQECLVFYCDF